MERYQAELGAGIGGAIGFAIMYAYQKHKERKLRKQIDENREEIGELKVKLRQTANDLAHEVKTKEKLQKLTKIRTADDLISIDENGRKVFDVGTWSGLYLVDSNLADKLFGEIMDMDDVVHDFS